MIGAVLIGLAAFWVSAARQVAVDQTKTEVRISRSIAERTHDVLLDVDTIPHGLRDRVQVDGTGVSNLARLNRLMAEQSAARR